MPDWTEEKLRYDSEYWGYNFKFCNIYHGYSSSYSGYNSIVSRFTEEPLVYGTVTEEI